MTKDRFMDRFYDGVHSFSEANGDISESEKVVVLFRVALERGAGEIGLIPTIHLLSKLLTTTIGVMAGEDEDVSFEGILDVFDVEDEKSN
jgi:hypothetical protein